MFSGGVGSWAAARRVAEKHGTEDLVLLFTDTLIEDADTYRFLREAAANVGGQLVEIADGRTPWQVFSDVRFLGNSRVDPCSRVLKRDLADAWLAEHYEPENVIVYVGIDWSEIHRYERLRERKRPWVYEAPLCDPPYLTKDDLHEWAELAGLERQRLYQLGMPHANCGGGCIKMGQGGFRPVACRRPVSVRRVGAERGAPPRRAWRRLDPARPHGRLRDAAHAQGVA
jgi:3'-phosphoadenosine 5'-phosphosulfate sulfotransferase (PAPS reductase)/FAD synthetase